MLTEKQLIFFNLIKKYYTDNLVFPSIGDLLKNSNYKSYNTIRKYLNKLELKEYIKLNKERNKIIYIKDCLIHDEMIKVPFISLDKYINISKDLLPKNNNYVAYKLNRNMMQSYFLQKGDILIIDKSNTYLNNKIVLVNIDNCLKVLKYIKKDGFIHLINDKKTYFLIHEKDIIGKVVLVIRNTMD